MGSFGLIIIITANHSRNGNLFAMKNINRYKLHAISVIMSKKAMIEMLTLHALPKKS